MAATNSNFDYTSTYSLHYAYAKDINNDELSHMWHHKVPGVVLHDLIVRVRRHAAANPDVSLACIEAVQETPSGSFGALVFRWVAA